MPKKTNPCRTTLAALDPVPPMRKKVSEFAIPSAEHPSKSAHQQIIAKLENSIAKIDKLLEHNFTSDIHHQINEIEQPSESSYRQAYQKIQLETTGCQFVGFLNIPKFSPMYEAVLWGERLFVKATTGKKQEVYREQSMYVSVSPLTT